MNGIEVIKEALKNIPESSGVYRMIGEGERLLYIGKAKNLKNRVTNYTIINGLSSRIARMVFQIVKVEFTATATESQALMLEAHLIKHNRPPYNILLRDDKSFPYIAIDNSHDFPRIYKYRGSKKKNISYYGPYPTAFAVNQTIKTLQKLFLIRPCENSFFSGRKRPCIEHEIKRCTAPCVGKILKEDYAGLIASAKDFLSGRSDEIKHSLQEKMQAASDSFNYEQAAFFRDRITALSTIQSKQPINCQTVKDADMIAVFAKGPFVAIQVFFIRNSYILGNTAYFPKGTEDMSHSEILEIFAASFYETKPVPEIIITNVALEDKTILENALKEISGNTTEIIIPQKGEKKDLITMAENNARLALEKKLAEEENATSILKKIEQLFGVKKEIRRIEVFDNSHIFGKNAIAGMIVAGFDEESKWGFQKKLYRKFNVDSGEKETGGDDFYMMKQALTRRYERIKSSDTPDYPEIVLIDGGAAQLTAAYEVFKELNILDKFTFIGIAKGPDRNAGNEEFYMLGREPFRLEPNSAELYFLQNIRDEAHRFAITSHRNKRKTSFLSSALTEIPDIGTVRKRALLNYFGSVKAIEAATIEQLSKVDGINKATAEKIHSYFH